MQRMQAEGVACLNVAILQKEITIASRPDPGIPEILSDQAQPLPPTQSHSVCSMVAGITLAGCFLQALRYFGGKRPIYPEVCELISQRKERVFFLCVCVDEALRTLWDYKHLYFPNLAPSHHCLCLPPRVVCGQPLHPFFYRSAACFCPPHPAKVPSQLGMAFFRNTSAGWLYRCFPACPKP